MATVNQIYQIVNDACAEALGESAITAKDTGTLVSLGTVVLSSADNKDAFFRALMDRIGRTVIAVREYKKKDRSVMKDDMEWGLVYQKISFKPVNASTNNSWTSSAASPYDITSQTEAVQKLFSVLSTWEYDDVIPDYQLFTAFTSAERMGAFISGIYTNMKNYMEKAEESLADLAVSTFIAGVLKSGTNAQKRDLLTEYNTLHSTSLTAEQALANRDFLKYANREILLAQRRIRNMTTMFNAEGVARHTPEDKAVVEVLSEFATASAFYLESDTYHKDLVELPKYEEVNYWQAPGTTYAFEDTSSINITNAEIDADNAVEQTGIVAVIHDYDAVASIITRRRSYSKFNEAKEELIIMEKADQGYAVDLSENGVVFYLGEQ